MHKIIETTVVAKALSHFHQGFYCSEAIVKAFNEHLGLQLSDSALRMATAFGAGLGGSKCLCGSLAGTVLVLSAMKGRVNLEEKEGELLALTRELHDNFKQRFRYTCCRALTNDVEWGSPGHHEFCRQFVEGAAADLASLLNRINEGKIDEIFRS